MYVEWRTLTSSCSPQRAEGLIKEWKVRGETLTGSLWIKKKVFPQTTCDFLRYVISNILFSLASPTLWRQWIKFLSFFASFLEQHVSEAVGFLLVVFGRLDDWNSWSVCFLLLITSDCMLLSCNFRFLVLANICILRLIGAGTPPLICHHLSHSNLNCWRRLNLLTLYLKSIKVNI